MSDLDIDENSVNLAPEEESDTDSKKRHTQYADNTNLVVRTASRPRGANNNNNNNSGSNIKVAVRKRPKIPSREDEETDIVRCQSDGVAVYEPRTKLDLTPVIEPSLFSFDTVFDEKATNKDVYESCCRPLLQSVVDGGVAVVFAFGQTGSGKTYTMLGKEEESGLYGLAVTDLLHLTGNRHGKGGEEAPMSASFYEVYGPKLYDLLNDRTELKMLQDENKTIHIVGLTERPVRTVEDVHALMTSGQQLRAIGTTHANDRSSRSHAVLEIKIKINNGDENNTIGGSGGGLGRMTFVDLAGSERASDTAETDLKTRREGAEINKSLLALKECIRAMSMRKKHIPFRGSKLTQILRESFDGRSNTCMIATVSPCQTHCEDTLNTLRYADRIKELKGPAGAFLGETPVPCKKCGLPIFPSDPPPHICRKQLVVCPYCKKQMDKKELDGHLAQCGDVPLRCEHCGDRMIRADLPRHLKRCLKAPIKCAACGQSVSRQWVEKHNSSECTAVKEKCRYCSQLFPRSSLSAHEASCDLMKVACTFCLKFVRKRNLDTHVQSCLRNPNRAPPKTSTDATAEPSPARPSVGAAAAVTTSESTSGASASREATPPPSCVRSPRLQSRAPLSPGGGAEDSLDINNNSSSNNNNSTADAVGCPYAKYGCPVLVTRLNIAAHLSEAIAEHLEYVTHYADRADLENAQLRQLVVKDSVSRPKGSLAKNH